MTKNDESNLNSYDFPILSTTQVASGAIIALREDQVKMPQGNAVHRMVVEHFGAVAIVAINEFGQIALIRQFRHPLRQFLWEIPAGLLDGAREETALSAAMRELWEETGYAAKSWHLLIDIATSPGISDEVVRIFIARDLYVDTPPDRFDEESVLTLEWLPQDEVVQRILNGEIINAIAVAALMTFMQLGEKALRSPDAPFPLRPHALRERRETS